VCSQGGFWYSAAMRNLYQVREISVLSFNERVLQEAEDPRNPLLERLKFLGIFSSNMDEFFKVRVAGIQRRLELGERKMADLLEVVGNATRDLDERFQAAYADIIAALEKEGIRLLTEIEVADQPEALRTWLRDYFQDNVLPGLVPIILQDQRPCPALTDGALYFAVQMLAKKKPRYAILEIPSTLPRFVELPNGNIMYIDDVIRHSLDELFYIFSYNQIEAYEFKISRDAELDIDNDFSEGYVRKMQKVLQQRKGGRPTRCHYDAEMPGKLRKRLLRELRITEGDTVIGGGRYHNMKDLMRFPARRPDLTFERMEPVEHPVLDGNRAPMLDIIRKQDLLVTYPYQSFDHVIRLLREAAIDPKVDEIKITIYRAARNSQVINALVNAARNGKKVFRFDEQNNIQIAERLAEAGAKVAYGVPPMKVHAKLLLIQRDGAYYAGLSTGNYNEVTSKLYVDSILLTADKRITSEVRDAFSLLDRPSGVPPLTAPAFTHLLMSPFNSRKGLMKLIQREEKKRGEGYIFIKTNHLTDAMIIKKLRKAADVGVHIELVVRTTYAVPPHERIRATSILDRNLEHQRIYVFGKGKDLRVYLSSADLMERNLDWRVEAAFPIYDPGLQQQVLEMMAWQAADNCKARILDQMQTNRYVEEGAGPRRAQYDTYAFLERLGNRSVSEEPAATSRV